MFKKKSSVIVSSVAFILGVVALPPAYAGTHVTTIDLATYNKVGTITFDDWGFVGPNGRTATDFAPVDGFNTNAVGQIQHVVTRNPDLLTPDAPVTIIGDLYGFPMYGSANVDAMVSFYHWGYTTKAGSTFSNMLIDTDGDYFVAQKDMVFQRYDDYQHNSDLAPGDPDYYADGTYRTRIAFQPYVLSDGRGWCGSILASNPGALEPMAGQIQFDFAFDVYFQTSPGVFTYSSTEIVKNFQMRSYGSITVDIDNDVGATSDPQVLNASAVVNNTNPGIFNMMVDGAPTDPNYYNLVSFMGAGVLDKTGRCGILNPNWVSGSGLTDTSNYKFTGLIDGPTDQTSCTTAGGTWQNHAYTGFAYILRADGIRVIEAMDYAAYPNLNNVPNVIGGLVAYNNDENAVLQPVADITGTPNAFAFANKGALVNTLTYSDAVTLTGLARDTVITITDGEYSINSGAFTSGRGVVVNNDSVQIRATSSSNIDTTVTATLTVGSVSSAFNIISGNDTDGDGVIDAFDNCTLVANADQADTDGDNYGNACDADFNNDGLINIVDIAPFKAAYKTQGANIDADLNNDGIVNNLDLGRFKNMFFAPPGPSGLIQ